MVYTGKGSYIFLKSENQSNVNNFGYSAAAVGADRHIPINPIVDLATLPEPKYKEMVLRTLDSEIASIIYTELLEKGQTTLETIYKDPFLMALAFHKKVVDTWSGTDDDITMDFTATTHRETFMIHIHIEDQSTANNDIDRTFYGCQINRYAWKIETGKLMKEIAGISCINAQSDVQLMSQSESNFHDDAWTQSGVNTGGWSDWDPNAPYHSSQITPTIGGAITAFKPKTIEIGFEYPKMAVHTLDSRIPSIEWDDFRTHYIEFGGIILTDASYQEVLKTYANKTLGTVKVTYGDAGKYMQFTNGYLKSIGQIKIPPRNVVLEDTIRYEGGVASALDVALRYSIATDPDPLITS